MRLPVDARQYSTIDVDESKAIEVGCSTLLEKWDWQGNTQLLRHRGEVREQVVLPGVRGQRGCEMSLALLLTEVARDEQFLQQHELSAASGGSPD
jgi:hypothetical protein